MPDDERQVSFRLPTRYIDALTKLAIREASRLEQTFTRKDYLMRHIEKDARAAGIWDEHQD